MGTFDAKRISDLVHGSIGLSDLEVQIIETSAFQRLRNVKHLGLAYFVFPGADFSRFAHSLGVCHVTGRTIDAIRNSPSLGLEERDVQLYRVAALLHDVGHYPFSHAMEDAIADYYSQSLYAEVETSGSDDESEPPAIKWFKHERVGKQVLTGDPEIKRLLTEQGFTPEEVAAIFLRENPPKLANLVSSDFDADRIDYLLRTARHTGLPYGSVDLDYILTQLRVDDEGRICLTPKALRAADHFLLSRYFDYQQVAFHKTVAALELTLKDVLRGLLDERMLDCSATWVTQAIETDQWRTFDEAAVMRLIRELSTTTENEVLRLKATAVLDRRPPKLVWQTEYLSQRDAGAQHEGFRSQRRLLQHSIRQLAEEFDIPRELWSVWPISGLVLTKVGSHVPMSSVLTASDEEFDKAEQALHILDPRKGLSVPISEVSESLMSVLSDYALYILRLYVLLPPGAEAKRPQIEARVRQIMTEDE